MKSDLVKRISLRRVLMVIGSFIIGVLTDLSFSYFMDGIPVLYYDNLKHTDIISVQITQGDETVLLTDATDIEKAARFVCTLRYRFGKAKDSEAEVMYVFSFEDGTKMEIGANSTTVFKNGKQYRGDSDSCEFFITCTKGMFFHGRTARSGP